MTRTASGINVIISSKLKYKTVVKDLDDFLLKPLGKHTSMEYAFLKET